MKAVKEHKQFHLHYTRKETGETIETMVDAADVFRLIAETNWDYAEPGALFWDRICNWNLWPIRRNLLLPVSILVQKNHCQLADLVS